MTYYVKVKGHCTSYALNTGGTLGVKSFLLCEFFTGQFVGIFVVGSFSLSLLFINLSFKYLTLYLFM